MKHFGNALCTSVKAHWKQGVLLLLAGLLLWWLLVVPHEPYTPEGADWLYRRHRKMFDALGEYLMSGAVPPGSYFDSWEQDFQYAGIEIPPAKKRLLRSYYRLPIYSGSHVISIIGSDTGQIYSVLFLIYFEYRDDGLGTLIPIDQYLWYLPDEEIDPDPGEHSETHVLPSGGSDWYFVSRKMF